MNDPYRLRYTNQIVGVFLLILLIFLLVLSIMIFQTNDYFIEKDRYWIDVAQQEVEGLKKGSDVLILGERAGKVESIRYIEDSSLVRVNIEILPEFSKQIFESSTVALQRRFGVGEPQLIIRRGMPPEGDFVQLQPENKIVNFQGEEDRLDLLAEKVESVADSISKIQLKLDPTLTQIDRSAQSFERGLDEDAAPAFRKLGDASAAFKATNEQLRPEASQTMAEIRKSTKNLDDKISALTDKVNLLVESDVKETLQDIRDTTGDVSDAAGSVGDAADQTGEDIADTLVKIRDAADRVEQLANEARDVVRVVRKEARELPGTVEQFHSTVDDTQDMVGEIRSHWLLRRYTDQSKSTHQISPSGVRPGSLR